MEYSGEDEGCEDIDKKTYSDDENIEEQQESIDNNCHEENYTKNIINHTEVKDEVSSEHLQIANLVKTQKHKEMISATTFKEIIKSYAVEKKCDFINEKVLQVLEKIVGRVVELSIEKATKSSRKVLHRSDIEDVIIDKNIFFLSHLVETKKDDL